jgi:DNA polymerase I-like protein with 3'-5' exonuclease and polymerase domains
MTVLENMPKHVSVPCPSKYYSDNYLVLDFEIDTSYGDYGHPLHKENQMLLACWHYAGQKKSLWGNEFQMAELLDDLTKCDFMIAHQAKYELGWLKRMGFDIGSLLVFDTKIAEYVLAGNLQMDTSLNACCIRRGMPPKDPVVDLLMKRGVNPVEMPRSWLEGRCLLDVESTEKIFHDQRRLLGTTNRLGVLYTRCLFTPVLADAEFQGMRLDKERVYEEYAAALEAASSVFNELNDLVGGINLNSPKQLGEYLYDTLGFKEVTDRKGKPVRTATGGRATDSKTLAKLKAKTPEQEQFLKLYTQWTDGDTSLSKYLEFYKAVVDEHDEVFYAEFNQTVTKTHRLSSSGMKVMVTDRNNKTSPRGTQFQNQPRQYKRFFRPKRDGDLFTEWDGSGLEFRVAGLVGKDQQIKDDINDPDFDPHTKSASVIFKRDYDALRGEVLAGDKGAKQVRTAAKAFTFKPLFGGQSGTEDEVRWYTEFNTRYSQLVATQNEWLKSAFNSGVVVTEWGMRYYFPNMKADKSGYIEGRTNVFNYPIQGFATAELIPIAASYFWHEVRARGLQNDIVFVNTVHDSVLAEVNPAVLEQYKEIVLEAWKYVYFYVEKVYNLKLEGLPLGTEITVGTHWGEGDSEAYNIFVDRVEAA